MQLSDKQLKVKMMFDHLAPLLLKAENGTAGAFYMLRKVFPVSADQLESMRDKGIISCIPGTNQYFYASVLWDMLWHEQISPASVFEATASTPTTANNSQRDGFKQRIIDTADAALAKRLNGKH